VVAGLVVTVSIRAFIVEKVVFGSLARPGTSPHFVSISRLPPACSSAITTGLRWFGAMVTFGRPLVAFLQIETKACDTPNFAISARILMTKSFLPHIAVANYAAKEQLPYTGN
jgi:hypothetical protein